MYRTIYREGTGNHEVKKSKFLGYAKPVRTEDGALSFIEEIRKMHPQARHHCSAYVLGAKGLIQRYDDDKEPSGTAGVPMLDVLKREGLTDLCVVVVRYFGGTLLGTGGLVRAYTLGCQLALEDSRIVEMVPYKIVRLSFSYPAYGELEYYFHKEEIPILSLEYTDKVTVVLGVSGKKWPGVESRFMESTSGEGKILECRDIFAPEEEGILIEESLKTGKGVIEWKEE